MNIRKLVIAIDFDDTIAVSRWPNIGDPIPGAIQTIQKLRKHGHKIIIWSCRSGKPAEDAIRWLHAHKVPFDKFNDNLPERIKAYSGSNSRKVSADLYVDDKGLGMRKVKPAELWEMVRKEVNRMSLEG